MINKLNVTKVNNIEEHVKQIFNKNETNKNYDVMGTEQTNMACFEVPNKYKTGQITAKQSNKQINKTFNNLTQRTTVRYPDCLNLMFRNYD